MTADSFHTDLHGDAFAQDLAKTAWAVATVGRSYTQLEGLIGEQNLRIHDFEAQDLPNTCPDGVVA